MSHSFTRATFLLFLTILPFIVIAQPYRILCLGNSITHGNSSYASYRYPLWKKLIDAGINFEYIGSHNVNNAGPSPEQDKSYKGKTFTNYNEGHWGWSADQILYGNDGEPAKGKLSQWLTGYTPDIVLMHLGTNDMFRNHSVDETLNELREVVAQIRGKNANVTILLAKLIPAYDQAAGPQAANNIQLLNARIPDLAEELSTAASPVILVDQNTGFNATTGADTWDGIHPNESGEEKMAHRWFEALQPLFMPLPVTLISFNANLTPKGDVKLTWETASEQQNAYFEIQRATDSAHFIPIGTVKGAGNSSSKRRYHFSDRSAPAGNLYYRLRQVDRDGSSKLSRVAHIAGTSVLSNSFIYPTTTQNQDVTILLQKFKPGTPVEVAIYAANGTLVNSSNEVIDASGNYREVLQVADLQGHGLYFVSVSAGGRQMQHKFIVLP